MAESLYEQFISTPNNRTKNDMHLQKRIQAGRRLIKIATEPPTYINTKLITTSPVLTVIACLESAEENKFGDKCLVYLHSDGIPRETWVLFGLLAEGTIKFGSEYTINSNTLDDLFYICYKYDVPLTYISDITYSKLGGWVKLQSVIIRIVRKNCKQYFPRMLGASEIGRLEIDKFYKALAYVFAEHILNIEAKLQKLQNLQSFEIIPPLHSSITLILATKLLVK